MDFERATKTWRQQIYKSTHGRRGGMPLISGEITTSLKRVATVTTYWQGQLMLLMAAGVTTLVKIPDEDYDPRRCSLTSHMTVELDLDEGGDHPRPGLGP